MKCGPDKDTHSQDYTAKVECNEFILSEVTKNPSNMTKSPLNDQNMQHSTISQPSITKIVSNIDTMIEKINKMLDIPSSISSPSENPSIIHPPHPINPTSPIHFHHLFPELIIDLKRVEEDPSPFRKESDTVMSTSTTTSSHHPNNKKKKHKFLYHSIPRSLFTLLKGPKGLLNHLLSLSLEEPVTVSTCFHEQDKVLLCIRREEEISSEEDDDYSTGEERQWLDNGEMNLRNDNETLLPKTAPNPPFSPCPPPSSNGVKRSSQEAAFLIQRLIGIYRSKKDLDSSDSKLPFLKRHREERGEERGGDERRGEERRGEERGGEERGGVRGEDRRRMKSRSRRGTGKSRKGTHVWVERPPLYRRGPLDFDYGEMNQGEEETALPFSRGLPEFYDLPIYPVTRPLSHLGQESYLSQNAFGSYPDAALLPSVVTVTRRKESKRRGKIVPQDAGEGVCSLPEGALCAERMNVRRRGEAKERNGEERRVEDRQVEEGREEKRGEERKGRDVHVVSVSLANEENATVHAVSRTEIVESILPQQNPILSTPKIAFSHLSPLITPQYLFPKRDSTSPTLWSPRPSLLGVVNRETRDPYFFEDSKIKFSDSMEEEAWGYRF